MGRNDLQNTDIQDISDIRRQAKECLEKAVRLFNWADELEMDAVNLTTRDKQEVKKVEHLKEQAKMNRENLATRDKQEVNKLELYPLYFKNFRCMRNKQEVKKAKSLLEYLAKQTKINGENLDAKNKQGVKKADPLADALEGRLNRGDIVEYGYQIKLGSGRKKPLTWSYMVIDSVKYFVCTDVIGYEQFSENDDFNWERSYLKKSLDENTYKLYTGSKSSLGEDDRIDGGITILSKDQYLKISKDLPESYDYWLYSTDMAYYATRKGECRENHLNYVCRGVRPAFRLK